MNKNVVIVSLLVITVILNYVLSKDTISEVRVSNSVEREVAENFVPEEDVYVGVSSTDTYLVTRVIDGDTIDVDVSGETKRVRYIGIDTPENNSATKSAECFAKEATERNKELVEGKYVSLEKDVNETDKYGRLLRYVYIGDTLVNLALIEGGYANILTIPPDINKADIFLQAERAAKKEGKGLWGDVCN